MTRKTAFVQGWSCSKFNNFRLALGTNLTFYTSLAKGLKLKARKFWGLIATFLEVTGKKLNRVKITINKLINLEASAVVPTLNATKKIKNSLVVGITIS